MMKKGEKRGNLSLPASALGLLKVVLIERVGAISVFFKTYATLL